MSTQHGGRGAPGPADATESKSATFRNLIAAGEPLLIPTCYDAMTARMIEAKGFRAVGVGGLLGAATLLAEPDFGVMTWMESVTRGCNIARAIDAPIVLDLDDGGGSILSAIRMVGLCVEAGVAAAHIEDQRSPKTGGQYTNAPAISLVDTAEMVARIRAVKDSLLSRSPDFFLIARTDSLGAGCSVDDTLARMAAYERAGADALLVISRDQAKLQEVGRQWTGKPLLTSPTRFPWVSIHELHDWGFSAGLYSEVAVRAALRAVDLALDVLLRDGSAKNLTDQISSIERIYEVSRVEERRELLGRYANPSVVT